MKFFKQKNKNSHSDGELCRLLQLKCEIYETQIELLEQLLTEKETQTERDREQMDPSCDKEAA